MKTTISCADCGHDQVVSRRNARYCYVCRTFRDLIYLGSRRGKCSSCQEKFAPIKANDRLCANCDFLVENNPTGHCAFCDKDGLLISPELAVCVACAKNPELRDKVTQAVGKKRRLRQEAKGLVLAKVAA